MELLGVTGITIAEWKRYGHHRGYATDASGERLGFVDLKTGAVSLEPGAASEPATSLLLAWAATLGAEPTTASDPNPVPTEPEWHDLATNRPGELVRAKADAAWEIEKKISPVLARAARLANVRTDERAWRKGAEGEERVGPMLDSLAKYGWRTLHSIPVGKQADIDHLSVGPGGVIVFNTKHNHGAKFSVSPAGVFVNGAKTEYVPQTRDQARRAHECLSRAGVAVPFVTPWVVLVNGSLLLQPEMRVGVAPKGIKISTNHNLKINVRRLEPVLSDEQVEAIYEVVRRSSTWQ